LRKNILPKEGVQKTRDAQSLRKEKKENYQRRGKIYQGKKTLLLVQKRLLKRKEGKKENMSEGLGASLG